MHVEKNKCNSLLGTMLGIERKSKDIDNLGHDLDNLKTRLE